MTTDKLTSLAIYKDDLKWLKKRKIDEDANTLAESFRNLRQEVEGEE